MTELDSGALLSRLVSTGNGEFDRMNMICRITEILFKPERVARSGSF